MYFLSLLTIKILFIELSKYAYLLHIHATIQQGQQHVLLFHVFIQKWKTVVMSKNYIDVVESDKIKMVEYKLRILRG